MPLALTLIDLDGFDAIDPVTVLVILIMLAGAAVAVSVIAIAAAIDRRQGRA